MDNPASVGEYNDMGHSIGGTLDDHATAKFTLP